MSRTRYVIGNWKMNGTRQGAALLARAVATGVGARRAASPGVVLCPPATLLAAVAPELGAGRVAELLGEGVVGGKPADHRDPVGGVLHGYHEARDALGDRLRGGRRGRGDHEHA
ncbi:MAG: triose-phosphate isomerase, partial [Alphaproteobacteria bacterium]